jgi:hypothetical protein
MKITIKELRQLVKSVISENLSFDGSEYSYEETDDELFAFEFKLNPSRDLENYDEEGDEDYNIFEVEGKYYGNGEILFDIIRIYTDEGEIDATNFNDKQMLKYAGMDLQDFDDYVIGLIEN